MYTKRERRVRGRGRDRDREIDKQTKGGEKEEGRGHIIHPTLE